MEDKQIIELYWERSNEAIQKTEEKYGQYVSYIAHHILQDEAEAARCIKECYDVLWETIPPHKPQNLKAYLCKITRNHALQMKYPVANPEIDLFSAEIVIYNFLRGLETKQRKLFVSRYWYMSLVSEIAAQYKMSQNKVNATLETLRQKLDAELEQKNIKLQTETELLCAMTEIEDKYLEEALPQMETFLENVEGQNHELKASFSRIWKKHHISIMACVIGVVFLVFIWPKHPVVNTPTENPNTEHSNTENSYGITDLENLISIFSRGSYHKDELEEMREMIPWKEDMEMVALPVYKKVPVSDVDVLIAKATEVAQKLNMNIIETNLLVGGQYTDQTVQVITDKGSIQVDDRGKITVTYNEEVNLENKCEMSDSATIEEANENVGQLMMEFGDAMGIDHFDTISYPKYDSEGKRTMNYRAVAADLYRTDVEQILNYAFNTIEFYYKEDVGLTGFCYGDIRFSTEDMGYYPIVSFEIAKKQLQEGNFKCELFDLVPADFTYEAEDILGVELMYKTNYGNEYYMPYYCFYIYVDQVQEYVRFYVPAIQGASADDKKPVEPAFKIIDLNGYQFVTSLGYMKDEKNYSIVNGELQEVEILELFGNRYQYGEVWVTVIDDEEVTYFSYGSLEELNLTEIMKAFVPDKKYYSLNARYIDGKVLIIGEEESADASQTNYMTHYLYSFEQNTLTQVMEPIPKYHDTVYPYGITYDGGRYATNRNTDDFLWIVDLISGKSVNTGIRNEDVWIIQEASNEHYAVVLQTGEIAVVEKESGAVIKRTKYQLDSIPQYIRYKDGLVYIEPVGSFVYVISEFAVTVP